MTLAVADKISFFELAKVVLEKAAAVVERAFPC